MLRFLGLRSHQSFVRYLNGFDVPLANQGIVLIDAENRDVPGFNSNGAGKTTLLADALSWGLFGKMLRYGNERLSASDVCVDGHTAHVEIDLETPRGVFRVARTQRPDGSPTLSIFTPHGVDDDGDDDWTLLPDQGQHARDATERLTALLGFDYLTMRSALILQGSAFGHATFSDEMKVLESVLRFEQYTSGKKIASTRRDALDRAMQSTLDDLQRHSGIVEMARHTLTELETLDESDRERELINEIQALKKTIRALGDVVTAHDKAARHVRESASSELGQRADLVHARRHLESVTAVGSVCAICQSRLSVKQQAVLVTEAQARVEHLEEAHLEAQADLEEVEARERSAYAQRVASENQIRRREAALVDLAALRERAAKRLGLIRTQTVIAAAAEQRCANLTAQIADARRQHSVADQWARRDFDGLKAATFRDGAPILNAAAAQYSDLFTDGAIRVSFPLDKTDGSILRIEGASAPTYQGCSAGERRRVDVIKALALRDLARWRMGGPVSLAVWDEVLDPLDASGVERAMTVLQEDMDTCETVLIVTHSEAVRALFPSARVWSIIREGGTSRVETD